MSVRYRKQIYPRRHVEPDFTRKLMLAICEPVMARDKRQTSDKCFNLQKRTERKIHPYDKLLAEDMKQELRSSRMICFFHTNVTSNRDRFEARNKFQHEDLYLRFYNEDVAQLAMSGTKYESALHLCRINDWYTQRHVTILFSTEPQVNKVLKITKKIPQLILMAAIIDDRFLSVDDMKEYGRLPDLQTLRAQVCHTLSLAAQSLVGNTSHPVRALAQSLDLYKNDKNK